MTDIHFTCSS